jgi:hypothetical protein
LNAPELTGICSGYRAYEDTARFDPGNIVRDGGKVFSEKSLLVGFAAILIAR